MKEENINYLKASLEELKITFNEEKIAIILDFYNDLIEFNSHTNLTRIIDEKYFIDKHLIDSLSIANFIEKKSSSIIDIGTGAGFPLMPLLIFYPEIKATFVDSVNKKLDFSRNFIKKLNEKYNFNTKNISVIHSRAEDLAKSTAFREKFDIVVSRGVSKFVSLTELNMPFIKKHGLFLAMKLDEVETELEEASKIIELTGGKVLKVEKFSLPQTELKRSLTIIEKIKTTPKDFPRKAGLAQKEPII